MGKVNILKQIIKEEIKNSLLNDGLGDRMSKKISKHKGTRNRDDMKKVYKLLRKYGNNKNIQNKIVKNLKYCIDFDIPKTIGKVFILSSLSPYPGVSFFRCVSISISGSSGLK